MCDERQYVCGSDLTAGDVSAYDRGELVEWRRAPDGIQWYRRLDAQPVEFLTIKAVPPQAAASASDSDVFDEPIGLDDFERAQLQQWADDLRHAGDDADSNVEDDDHDAE